MKHYFEDCHVGETVRTSGRTVTEADLVGFAAISGDWSPAHVDAEFARTTPAGGRTAHGLLPLAAGMGLLSQIGPQTLWPDTPLTITRLDKIRFVGPVLIGDTLHVEAEIDELKPLSDEQGLITTRLRIQNQRNEPVMTLRVQLMAARRPKPTA